MFAYQNDDTMDRIWAEFHQHDFDLANELANTGTVNLQSMSESWLSAENSTIEERLE